MNKTILTVLILGLMSFTAYGQAYLRGIIPYHKQITLPTESGGRIRATLLEAEQRHSFHLQRWYHGYKSGGITRTQGSVVGRLLHGPYEETYAGHVLKEQGIFQYGLKNGEWLHWDTAGTLRQVSFWRKGQESGPYRIYNARGELAERGHMRKGLKHGMIKRYIHTDSLRIEKQKYQAGKPMAKGKSSWGRRWLNRLQIKLPTKQTQHDGHQPKQHHQ